MATVDAIRRVARNTGSFYVPREQLGAGASRTQLKAMWAAARARNALRRRWQLAGLGALMLVATLLTIVLLPRQAARLASLAAPRPGEKVDTLALAAAAGRARADFVAADSAMQVKRSAGARARAAANAAARAARAAAALAAGGTALRDSLTSVVAELDRLLGRVETSPLPTSYRALADAAALRGDGRVRQLVDSLDDVEREREAFGVVSGVDPIYVQLTNTINRLGRAIAAVAERQRGAAREQLAALGGGDSAAPPSPGPPIPVPGAPTVPAPTAPTVPAAPNVPAGVSAPPAPLPFDTALAVAPVAVDTVVEAVASAAARLRRDSVESQLAAARARNQAVDRRVAAARAEANVEAPPAAMLASATALALVLAFGVLLGGEVRRPRVADAGEAERVSRARVLAVVRPESVTAERARRAADRDAALPALIDPSVESYRMLYLSLAATGASIPVVALTGDDPAIVATVAANVAAVAAVDGRGTLVVDTDMGRALLSSALGVRGRLGLSDLARSNLPLAEAIVPVAVGRDLAVDVVPAGLAAAPVGGPATDSALDTLRLDLGRLARRYDFAVLGAPPSDSGAPALQIAPDVVVCARAGHTPLAGLAREVDRLRGAGARVRGLVLWDDAVPVV